MVREEVQGGLTPKLFCTWYETTKICEPRDNHNKVLECETTKICDSRKLEMLKVVFLLGSLQGCPGNQAFV